MGKWDIPTHYLCSPGLSCVFFPLLVFAAAVQCLLPCDSGRLVNLAPWHNRLCKESPIVFCEELTDIHRKRFSSTFHSHRFITKQNDRFKQDGGCKSMPYGRKSSSNMRLPRKLVPKGAIIMGKNTEETEAGEMAHLWEHKAYVLFWLLTLHCPFLGSFSTAHAHIPTHRLRNTHIHKL